MSSDTKILITLWIAFLLSFFVDANAQRGIASGRGLTINNNTTNETVTRIGLLEGDTIPGFIYGYLSTVYPDSNYSFLKTVRQANWEAFQAAVIWQKAAGGRRVIIPNIVEMHVNDGETITVSSGQTAVIEGMGQDVSKLIFYPIVKSYNVNIFNLDAAGSNLTVRNIYMQSTPQRHETYNVTIRPAGVTNQIRIDDAAVSAYLTANFVGKVINVAKDNITTPTPTFTVSGYNPATKTITVSSTITGISDDDTGYIAIAFQEDTDLDTIETYGDFWLENDMQWYIGYSVQGTNTTYARYLFENFKTVGFDLTVFRSGGSVTFEGINSSFTGHHGSIFFYSNNETDSRIILNNCKLENNSFYVHAYIDGAYTAGNYFGSAVYSHPNTQWLWSYVDIKDNNAAATRQYSSGGNKPTPGWASSILTGCRWINNVEYSIQTSQDMPVYFTNCYFEGNCYFNSDVIISNSKFKDVIVATYSTGTNLKIVDSQLTGTWFNIAGSRVEIENCQIQTIQNQVEALNISNTEYVIIKNTRFTNNPESRVVGNSVFGFSFPRKLICENVWFEDVDTPLFWRYSAADPSNSYNKSAFLPAKFTKCYFVYNSIIGSSQFVYYNNAIFDECTFGDGTENKGRWVVKPRDDFNPTTLSGATISVSPSFNRYFVSGSITKINSPSVGMSGPYFFTASSTTIFSAYNSSTNTGSNINFTDTIQAGETISMMWNPLDIKSASTSTATSENIGSTANGVLKKDVWNEIDFGSSTLVPGSITITAGGITFTDDGRGNLTATGGSGWIGYDTNMLTLYFDANPGVTNILITYNYYNTIHQAGMWSKID